MEIIREFFGFGGHQRAAEGYFSWQHLTFVTALMIVMTALAVWMGRRNRQLDPRRKNKVMIGAAIAIDVTEIIEIVVLSFRENDPLHFLSVLPLFLCSIQLITLPLAAFSTGRVKEASLDFVFIFGLLGAVLGTYAAGQNYGCYPVISFNNVISGLTHAISGFAALYIAISGMASMKRKNIWITISILLSFAAAAYLVNCLNYPNYQHNYMFLTRGDGTPYDLLYNLVGGNPILYPLGVVVLFLLYIVAFYAVYYAVTRRNKADRV